MKPFILEEYLKFPKTKIVTRGRHSVRIICTDAKGIKPIIALLSRPGIDDNEYHTGFYPDGKWRRGDVDDVFDLFFFGRMKK